jgi:hypothetical protein
MDDDVENKGMSERAAIYRGYLELLVYYITYKS